MAVPLVQPPLSVYHTLAAVPQRFGRGQICLARLTFTPSHFRGAMQDFSILFSQRWTRSSHRSSMLYAPWPTDNSLCLATVWGDYLLTRQSEFETPERYSACPYFCFWESGAHLPDPNPKIFDLPDNLFVEELCQFEATTLNVDQHSEIIALMLPTLRADFRIVQTYRYYPEKPLVCPITAFGGLQDKTTSEREMQQWRHHTGRAFNLVMLSGGHFFLDTAVNSVLKHIKAQLGSN